MVQPLHPLPSFSQNMVSKGDHGKGKRFQRGGDSSQLKNATEDGSERESLPSHTVKDRNGSQANIERGLPNSDSPEAILQRKSTQSTRTQSQAQKTSKEILSSPSSSHEGLMEDTPKIIPAEIHSPALAPVERKETLNIQEEKDELEEEELQELLSKLMDAFTLEMAAGKSCIINRDIVMTRDSGCLLKHLI